MSRPRSRGVPSTASPALSCETGSRHRHGCSSRVARDDAEQNVASDDPVEELDGGGIHPHLLGRRRRVEEIGATVGDRPALHEHGQRLCRRIRTGRIVAQIAEDRRRVGRCCRIPTEHLAGVAERNGGGATAHPADGPHLIPMRPDRVAVDGRHAFPIDDGHTELGVDSHPSRPDVGDIVVGRTDQFEGARGRIRTRQCGGHRERRQQGRVERRRDNARLGRRRCNLGSGRSMVNCRTIRVHCRAALRSSYWMHHRCCTRPSGHMPRQPSKASAWVTLRVSPPLRDDASSREASMSMVTVLDDYQAVALASADWSEVQAAHTVEVITEHIADESALVRRLAHSEIVVAMRERTPFTADVLAELPGPAAAGHDRDGQRLDRPRRRGAPRDRRVRHRRLRQRDARADDRDDDRADPQLRAGGRRRARRWLAAHDRAGPVRVRRSGWSGSAVSACPSRRLAQAFGMTVIAWSPNLTQARAEPHGVRAVDKQRAVLDGGRDHHPHAVVGREPRSDRCAPTWR